MFKFLQKADLNNLSKQEEKLLHYIRTIANGVVNISVSEGRPSFVKMGIPFEFFNTEEIARENNQPIELSDLEEYLLGTIKQMGFGMISVQVQAGLVVSRELLGTFISLDLDKNQPIAYNGNC